MGLKNYFKKGDVDYSRFSKRRMDISGSDVIQSFDFLKQSSDFRKKIFGFVDISASLTNYVRYGSAEYYFENGIERIYNEYPYDGSPAEKLKFHNNSNTFDYYLWTERYPKTTGYINLGTEWSSSVAADSSSLNFYNTLPESYIKISSSLPKGSKYKATTGQTNNLEIDFVQGNTVEFWFKRGATSGSKEVLFDVWNGQGLTDGGYGRFVLYVSDDISAASETGNKLYVHFASGSVSHIASFGATGLSSSLDVWHHYAVSAKSDGTDTTLKFYVDGAYSSSSVVSGKSVSQVTGTYLATIGALATVMTDDTESDGNISAEGWGRISGSFDEFRFWKSTRSARDVGLWWNDHVPGGGNQLLSSSLDLGFYYKFNEGITSASATDRNILDYSGRLMNTRLLEYDNSAARSTNSAIEEYSTSSGIPFIEAKDPIIYSNNPLVSDLLNYTRQSGSVYDNENAFSFYGLMPEWVRSEDDGHLRRISHIIGAYFDELFSQIRTYNVVFKKDYTEYYKPYPFYEKLLESHGFSAEQLFDETTLLESLRDRNVERLFSSGSVGDAKNKIFRNVYNNLLYIFKTKGTNSAIRNILHCYGVDENLIRLRTYSDNVLTDIENLEKIDQFKDKTIDFWGMKNEVADEASPATANVFNYTSSAVDDSGSYAYIPSLGKSYTLEANVYFPSYVSVGSDYYIGPQVSSSVFGIHAASSSAPIDTTFSGSDHTGLCVYTTRDGRDNKQARFTVTSRNGNFTGMSSDLFEVYDASNWNLALVFEPKK